MRARPPAGRPRRRLLPTRTRQRPPTSPRLTRSHFGEPGDARLWWRRNRRRRPRPPRGPGLGFEPGRGAESRVSPATRRRRHQLKANRSSSPACGAGKPRSLLTLLGLVHFPPAAVERGRRSRPGVRAGAGRRRSGSGSPHRGAAGSGPRYIICVTHCARCNEIGHLGPLPKERARGAPCAIGARAALPVSCALAAKRVGHRWAQDQGKGAMGTG